MQLAGIAWHGYGDTIKNIFFWKIFVDSWKKIYSKNGHERRKGARIRIGLVTDLAFTGMKSYRKYCMGEVKKENLVSKWGHYELCERGKWEI